MEGSSRRKHRAGCRGEMVETAGGRIVRCSGRKDRHSKVFTAKGLRDRRVRLSAHTAIQFYDVQDRLGYDRPSKAVDWLIQQARAAIDQLVESPLAAPREAQVPDEKSVVPHLGYNFGGGNGFFLAPPSCDAIEDSTKPVPSAAAALPPSYSELLLRAAGVARARDLRLAVHPFDNPILHDKQRTVWWNAAPTCGGGGEFVYNVALPPQANSQFPLCSQREPLQSSDLPSLREWVNPIPTTFHPSLASAAADVFFSQGFGSCSSFHVPARIQGEEPPQNNIANILHSASPASPDP